MLFPVNLSFSPQQPRNQLPIYVLSKFPKNYIPKVTIVITAPKIPKSISSSKPPSKYNFHVPTSKSPFFLFYSLINFLV